MFLHEIMKGADPSHLAFTGEVDVTYGALEDAIHRYRNAIYALRPRRRARQPLLREPCRIRSTLHGRRELGAIIVPVNKLPRRPRSRLHPERLGKHPPHHRHPHGRLRPFDFHRRAG